MTSATLVGPLLALTFMAGFFQDCGLSGVIQINYRVPDDECKLLVQSTLREGLAHTEMVTSPTNPGVNVPEECGANLLQIRHARSNERISCSRCSLGELCLPAWLNAVETGQLEQLVERSRPLRAGEHLFRAGDRFQNIAAVRSGCFKSYLVTEEGQEQVLDFFLPGEIVGFDAIHGGVHVSSCVALDTSAVCTLKFSSLSELSRQIPALQAELFDIMSHRIADLEMVHGDHGADQRFAMFLESLAKRYSRRGYSAREFTLAMHRRDIANYLRLANETISRILSRLKKARILDVRRKQIRILDPDALHAIAQGQDIAELS